ncbi:hypothetical protein U0035_14020 [Niabella yanshanensis]|uniref:Transposase n=1 Tax=Niabella yanshanensis TaxID=577386 RepID=A0ABZ0W253_9BACT|nr:hypothetical protein [Niabella yanshanensis]WQD36784.1 hypothetical protein U0035_14020 [Niabella yanshanensis]
MFKLLLTADQRALTSIIELYGARLRRYIRKWIPDASWTDEIMQDVFCSFGGTGKLWPG